MSSTKLGKRRSAAEWAVLVEACERSGLSRRQFAEREGVHPGTFGFWASRLAPRQSARRPATTAAAPSFVPVRVRSAEERESGAHVAHAKSRATVSDKVEVVLSNGRRVRCQLSQVDDPRLSALLALAEGAA
jgi:hypothetical protein